MTFKPGQSGNPAGRKKGISDRRLHFKNMLEENGKLVIDKAIELVKEGNVRAIEICLDRLIAKPKDNPIMLRFSEDASIAESLDTIINEMQAGEISPSEGKSFAEIIAIRNDAARTEALTEKLSQFETFMKTIGGQAGQQSNESE